MKLTPAQIIYQALGELVKDDSKTDRAGSPIVRCYRGVAHEGADTQTPYIVFNPSISTIPSNSDDGYLDYEVYRVQIDIYHDNGIDIDALAKQAVQHLNNYRNPNNNRRVFDYQGRQDMPTQTPMIYRVVIDGYIFIHENP